MLTEDVWPTVSVTVNVMVFSNGGTFVYVCDAVAPVPAGDPSPQFHDVLTMPWSSVDVDATFTVYPLTVHVNEATGGSSWSVTSWLTEEVWPTVSVTVKPIVFSNGGTFV